MIKCFAAPDKGVTSSVITVLLKKSFVTCKRSPFSVHLRSQCFCRWTGTQGEVPVELGLGNNVRSNIPQAFTVDASKARSSPTAGPV